MRTQEWRREEFFRWLDQRVRQVKPPIKDMQALSELSELSHSTLSNWRNGKYRPTMTMLAKLAGPLGVEPEVVWTHAGLIPSRLPEMPDDEQLIVQVVRASRLSADVQDMLIAAQLAELRRERDERLRQVRQQVEIMERQT